MSLRLPALMLAATLPLTGCVVAAVGAGAAVGVAAVQDRTMGEVLDDSTNGAEIKAKLISDDAEKFGEVDVEVANGLVLLSGRVNAPEDRVKAESVAWSASRTQDVANEIRIEPPGGFIANVSDEIISGRVRARLIGSKSVKSVNFNVETYNGVVYLLGIARSADELRHAAEEASYVSGVKQVVSYVRIREPRGTVPPEQVQVPQGDPASYQSAPDTSYGTDADAELISVSY